MSKCFTFHVVEQERHLYLHPFPPYIHKYFSAQTPFALVQNHLPPSEHSQHPLPLTRAADGASRSSRQLLAAEERPKTSIHGKSPIPIVPDQMQHRKRLNQNAPSEVNGSLDGRDSVRGRSIGAEPNISESAHLKGAKHMQAKHDFKYQHQLDRHAGGQPLAPLLQQGGGSSDQGNDEGAQRVLSRQMAFNRAQGLRKGTDMESPHHQVWYSTNGQIQIQIHPDLHSFPGNKFDSIGQEQIQKKQFSLFRSIPVGGCEITGKFKFIKNLFKSEHSVDTGCCCSCTHFSNVFGSRIHP